MDVISIISQVVTAILANWQMILAAVIGLFSALIVFFMAIPGDAPEKQLQSVVDFLSKFSRK
jgi:hypothetical protein